MLTAVGDGQAGQTKQPKRVWWSATGPAVVLAKSFGFPPSKWSYVMALAGNTPFLLPLERSRWAGKR